MKAQLIRSSLYRNLKDWTTLDELDIEIHFVKEGVVLAPDARSSDKLIHGIKVLMAKNYIDNLSEEARKGMQEKANQGYWPSSAPAGYRNVRGPDGRSIIIPDEKVAPVIQRAFALYATGRYTVQDISDEAFAMGYVAPRSGKRNPKSTFHRILQNPIYVGDFIWKGVLHNGNHEPLVSHELFDKVQLQLQGGIHAKPRRNSHDFAYTGILRCGHCGGAMVGQIQKNRYIYYHCSGYRGNCGDKYVREQIFDEFFTNMLGQLEFDRPIREALVEELRDSHGHQRRETEAAIKRIRTQHDRLRDRLHAAYVDKLDGKIDAEIYERIASEARSAQQLCLREITSHESAERSYLDDGIRLLELANDAQRLFLAARPEERRSILKFVLSNSSYRDGVVTAEFRQPFDLIAKTTRITALDPDREPGYGLERSEWRTRYDSNVRPLPSEGSALSS